MLCLEKKASIISEIIKSK